jgi:hypothetical protein
MMCSQKLVQINVSNNESLTSVNRKCSKQLNQPYVVGWNKSFIFASVFYDAVSGQTT